MILFRQFTTLLVFAYREQKCLPHLIHILGFLQLFFFHCMSPTIQDVISLGASLFGS